MNSSQAVGTVRMLWRFPVKSMLGEQVDVVELGWGEEFHADPFGPSFDPDAMLAALRAGTPESELLTRAGARTCPPRNVAELLLT
jgi:hypothetical protein